MNGLRLHHYRPDGRATGLVVLAPGSRGGMGPGQTKATQNLFSLRIRSIYTQLARRLCAQGVAVVQGANLINYFGKTNDIKDIEIAPILMRKGVTKLALYGLGEPPRSVLARQVAIGG